jgi:hypothetical protein
MARVANPADDRLDLRLDRTIAVPRHLIWKAGPSRLTSRSGGRLRPGAPWNARSIFGPAGSSAP